MKLFFIFLIFLTTIILPTNVFGFNQIDDKITHVGEMKKDQSGFTIQSFVTVEESHFESDQFNDLTEFEDLNLRWEPHNSFLGDWN